MKRPKRAPSFFVDEDALQIYAADVLRSFALPGVMYWHTPNGGYRPPSVANLMKRMGTKPGVPDLTLVVPQPFSIQSYSVGFVEIKLGKKGRLSEGQIEFKEACERLAIRYIVARSCDEIDNALRQLGAIDKPATQQADKADCVVQGTAAVKRGRPQSTKRRRAA